MEPVEDSQDDLIHGIKPRDFICPCGRTYLSYAALFTHIKQKHEGKAPGKIIKPPSMHPKRGRPPLKLRNQKNQSQNIHPNNAVYHDHVPYFEEDEDPAEKQQRQSKAKESIRETYRYINQMVKDNLNRNHLNEIEAFTEMTVYLSTRSSSVKVVNGNICVGDGIIQFIKQVCQNLTWKQFEPLYILFMLFLQFVIDTENRKETITESNLDILCEYLNEFIENNLSQMTLMYELQNLELLKYENSTKILNQFFHWAMSNRYISYKVTFVGEKEIKSTLSSLTRLDNGENGQDEVI